MVGPLAVGPVCVAVGPFADGPLCVVVGPLVVGPGRGLFVVGPVRGALGPVFPVGLAGAGAGLAAGAGAGLAGAVVVVVFLVCAAGQNEPPRSKVVPSKSKPGLFQIRV